MERVEALSAREAVAGWTPASLATSFSVARCTRAQYLAETGEAPIADSLPASPRDRAYDADDQEHNGTAGEVAPQVPGAQQVSARRGVAREKAGREKAAREKDTAVERSFSTTCVAQVCSRSAIG
jgi:hypothetical protein